MKRISENLVPILAVTGAAFLSLGACEKRDAKVSSLAASTTVEPEIDDAVVTTRAKSALLADHDTRSLDIKVETRKGTVQLSGYVDSRAQIDRVIEIVRGVAGVQDPLTEERGIHGQASPEQTCELIEEGIAVMPLPLPDGLKEPLQ